MLDTQLIPSMSNHLSIRSYSRQRHGHSHGFHQLVLPLRGVINIELSAFSGKVAPGECVVIRTGELHHFTANTEARFVVADMETLPRNLVDANQIAFSISTPLIRYLDFIEAQLEHQIEPEIEQSMFATFSLLLGKQRLMPRVDHRIQQVLQFMDQNLPQNMTISELSKRACLSETQFKKLFREQLGQSVMQYVTQKRMAKAKALLQHTDYPVQLIAEQVGYTDISAFSRRFSACFGLTPTRFSQ